MVTADASEGASCITAPALNAVVCGGQYSFTTAPSQPAIVHTAPTTPAIATPAPQSYIRLYQYLANGPNGLCLEVGPEIPTGQSPANDYAPLAAPACPTAAAPLPPIDPAALAVQFWRTIPLPVPHPTIPPGYAICGKPAYLVTNGSTQPTPYTEPTPIGTLTIVATGAYTIDWGDPSQPGSSGPYPFEGQAYPNGRIQHTYDNSGSYNVVVTENWTATWHLAGATGTLGNLHTAATVAGFVARQLEAIETN
jgi:hypothetical protein